MRSWEPYIAPIAVDPLVAGWSQQRRADARLLLESWAKADGFDDLIDYLYEGGNLQQFCNERALRISLVLKYIREDSTRFATYNQALVGSAEQMMNETLDIADGAPKDQLSMNHAALRIQTRARVAKTRAVGFDNTVRTEVSGPGGGPMPPVYVNFVPVGAVIAATNPDADPV